MVKLEEYRFSKQFIQDADEIFEILEECRKKLKAKSKYQAVKLVIDSIDEASESLNNAHVFYKRIIEESRK